MTSKKRMFEDSDGEVGEEEEEEYGGQDSRYSGVRGREVEPRRISLHEVAREAKRAMLSKGPTAASPASAAAPPATTPGAGKRPTSAPAEDVLLLSGARAGARVGAGAGAGVGAGGTGGGAGGGGATATPVAERASAPLDDFVPFGAPTSAAPTRAGTGPAVHPEGDLVYNAWEPLPWNMVPQEDGSVAFNSLPQHSALLRLHQEIVNFSRFITPTAGEVRHVRS
jgi:hypothetical protein